MSNLLQNKIHDQGQDHMTHILVLRHTLFTIAFYSTLSILILQQHMNIERLDHAVHANLRAIAFLRFFLQLFPSLVLEHQNA